MARLTTNDLFSAFLAFVWQITNSFATFCSDYKSNLIHIWQILLDAYTRLISAYPDLPIPWGWEGQAHPPSPHPTSPSSSPHSHTGCKPWALTGSLLELLWKAFLPSFIWNVLTSPLFWLENRILDSKAYFFIFYLFFLMMLIHCFQFPLLLRSQASFPSFPQCSHFTSPSLHHSAFKVPLYIMHFQQTDYCVPKYGFLWIYFSKTVGFLNF